MIVAVAEAKINAVSLKAEIWPSFGGILDLAGDTPFDTLTTPPDDQPGPHLAGAGRQRHCYIDGGVRSPDNADLAGTHEPPLLAVI
jgi:hypothetical protein